METEGAASAAPSRFFEAVAHQEGSGRPYSFSDTQVVR
jgi:hypothetical protein